MKKNEVDFEFDCYLEELRKLFFVKPQNDKEQIEREQNFEEFLYRIKEVAIAWMEKAQLNDIKDDEPFMDNMGMILKKIDSEFQRCILKLSRLMLMKPTTDEEEEKYSNEILKTTATITKCYARKHCKPIKKK